jgi:uncharacterized protein (DUF1330 family)
VLLVAVLTVRRARLDDFRRYEHAAAAIMARHGGAIERALVLDDGHPDEVGELHIVRFADAAGWAAYRADPELAALVALREAAVIATQLWPASEGPQYRG